MYISDSISIWWWPLHFSSKCWQIDFDLIHFNILRIEYAANYIERCLSWAVDRIADDKKSNIVIVFVLKQFIGS